MTETLEIKEGSEAAGIAAARFEAWLKIEKSRRLGEIEEKTSNLNRERARLNDLSEKEQRKMNQRRISRGEPSIVWPMEMLEVPAWQDSFLSSDRVRIARLACTMTRDEKEALRTEFGRKCDGLSSDSFQDVQHALGAWENGEEKRDEKARMEAVRQKASEIITIRKTVVESVELNFLSCFRAFGPQAGEFHGGSEWRPELWEQLTAKEKQSAMQQWERVERLLPVYYEYARDSVKLQQLALIHQTIEEEMPERYLPPVRDSGKPRLGGCPIHPLETEEKRGVEAFHGRIGGYAEAVIKSLGKFLVADMPYPVIPVRERKRAAAFAMNCNESHSMMGPWLTDAGPVLDPWVMGDVERDRVRLATQEEATTTAQIHYRAIISKEVHGVRIAHEDVIRFDGALKATTCDGQARNEQNRQQGHFRALEADGEEVLALKVVWNDTTDAELVEAFAKLLKQLRPSQVAAGHPDYFVPEADWPERAINAKRGSKWKKESKAALEALISLRKRNTARIQWKRANAECAQLEQEFANLQRMGRMEARKQAELEAKIRQSKTRVAELGAKYKSAVVNGTKRATANKCFSKIVGNDELPWWQEAHS